MKDEKILLCEGGGANERFCRVDKLIVPDIRFQGLFVSRLEQEVINYAYNSALSVHKMILGRDRNSYRKFFTIDIPDLWFIATGQKPPLRAELRDEIILFNMVFQSLVHHFIPKAKQTGYSYDGKTRHGIKYKGYASVSEAVEGD